MRDVAVIIIHGAYGHPEENWFGWMKRSLNSIGITCHVPQFPTPVGQSYESWRDQFEYLAKYIWRKETILIGHSLGALFLLRWLEEYKGTVYALILAGVFIGKVGIPRFDEINQSFFKLNINWQHITERVSDFSPGSSKLASYYGTSDPYVSKSDFDAVADKLNARKVIVSNAGHFNAASGYTEFHLLFKHIKNILVKSW